MPSNLSKPCRHPGCAETISTGVYCSAHTRPASRSVYDQTTRRDDPALAVAARIRSSARWQRFRHWFRARHPLCCDPFGEHGGMQVPTEQVHHVLGLALSPELACDENNCRPLCTACHGQVERMERAGQSTAKLFRNDL